MSLWIINYTEGSTYYIFNINKQKSPLNPKNWPKITIEEQPKTEKLILAANLCREFFNDDSQVESAAKACT